VLLDEGVLDRYADLGGVASLPERLDAIPTARRRWRAFEELLRKRSLPPDVHRALVRLARRTRFSRTPLGRLLRLDRRRLPRTPAAAGAGATTSGEASR
jgi:hypothetical protein